MHTAVSTIAAVAAIAAVLSSRVPAVLAELASHFTSYSCDVAELAANICPVLAITACFSAPPLLEPEETAAKRPANAHATNVASG